MHLFTCEVCPPKALYAALAPIHGLSIEDYQTPMSHKKALVCFHLCTTLDYGSPLGVVKGMLTIEAAVYNAVLVPRDLCSSFILQDQQDVK